MSYSKNRTLVKFGTNVIHLLLIFATKCIVSDHCVGTEWRLLIRNSLTSGFISHYFLTSEMDFFLPLCYPKIRTMLQNCQKCHWYLIGFDFRNENKIFDHCVRLEWRLLIRKAADWPPSWLHFPLFSKRLKWSKKCVTSWRHALISFSGDSSNFLCCQPMLEWLYYPQWAS